MTSFSAPLPNRERSEDKHCENYKSAKQSGKRRNALKEIFCYYTRIDSITKGLLRIIGVIVLAALAVGIFELLNRLT